MSHPLCDHLGMYLSCLIDFVLNSDLRMSDFSFLPITQAVNSRLFCFGEALRPRRWCRKIFFGRQSAVKNSVVETAWSIAHDKQSRRAARL